MNIFCKIGLHQWKPTVRCDEGFSRDYQWFVDNFITISPKALLMLWSEFKQCKKCGKRVAK